MSEIKYRICNCCGIKINKFYWNIQLSKNDIENVDADANLSQKHISLDLCETCKFKLERQMNKIKSSQKRNSSLRR